MEYIRKFPMMTDLITTDIIYPHIHTEIAKQMDKKMFFTTNLHHVFKALLYANAVLFTGLSDFLHSFRI